MKSKRMPAAVVAETPCRGNPIDKLVSTMPAIISPLSCGPRNSAIERVGVAVGRFVRCNFYS
jgi:hypothetical protein